MSRRSVCESVLPRGVAVSHIESERFMFGFNNRIEMHRVVQRRELESKRLAESRPALQLRRARKQEGGVD